MGNGLHKTTPAHNHGHKRVDKGTQGKKEPYSDEQLSTLDIRNERDSVFNRHPTRLVSVGDE